MLLEYKTPTLIYTKSRIRISPLSTVLYVALLVAECNSCGELIPGFPRGGVVWQNFWLNNENKHSHNIDVGVVKMIN